MGEPRADLVIVAEPLLVGSALAGRLVGMSGRSWQRLSAADAVPEPVRLGKRRLWRLDDLRAWVGCGCPSRERFEALMSSPRQAAGGNGLPGSPGAISAGVGLRHR